MILNDAQLLLLQAIQLLTNKTGS